MLPNPFAGHSSLFQKEPTQAVQEHPQHGSAGLGLTCHCAFSDTALLDLDRALGLCGLLPPCRPMQKKNHYLRLFIFLTVISLTFGSHVPTLPMSLTPGSLPNQCQLTLTEKDPWMDPSALPKPSCPPSPLPCPV